MTSHKIGVGILGAGAGNIATANHMPACLRSERVELIALCDRLESVHEFAAKAGVKGYTDYEAMLREPKVEMVHVATPDQFHCEHALTALKAGKHVLLQKPPCLTINELDTLRKAAAAFPGRLKIILNNRHTPLCRSIKHHLERKAIGELREIIIKYRGRRFPIDNPQSFYLTAASGGVWLHNSLHWLDEAFLYAGTLPTSIQVTTARNGNGEPRYLGEGPNYWSAMFPMGKVSLLFEYNTMLLKDGLPGGMRRILVGTEGEIRQDYGKSELVLHQKGSDTAESLPLLDGGADPTVDSFIRAIDDFALEMLDGTPCPPAIDDSLALFELLLQIVVRKSI